MYQMKSFSIHHCLANPGTLFVLGINSWQDGQVGGDCCQQLIDLCTSASRHNLSPPLLVLSLSCNHLRLVIFIDFVALLHFDITSLTPSCFCHCLVIIICLVIVIDLCTSLTPLLLSSSYNCYSMSLSLHVFDLNFDLCTSASRHNLSPPLMLLSLSLSCNCCCRVVSVFLCFLN